jgi:hypothetical protein
MNQAARTCAEIKESKPERRQRLTDARIWWWDLAPNRITKKKRKSLLIRSKKLRAEQKRDLKILASTSGKPSQIKITSRPKISQIGNEQHKVPQQIYPLKVKQDSNTIMKITVLPLSFDSKLKIEFLAHSYFRKYKIKLRTGKESHPSMIIYIGPSKITSRPKTSQIGNEQHKVPQQIYPLKAKQDSNTIMKVTVLPPSFH